jgi:hypothetical protein
MGEQQTVEVPRPGASPGAADAHGGRRTGLVAAIGLGVAAASALGVWLLWRVFVDTFQGQQVDQAALRGARFGQTQLWHVAEPLLSIVSVGFVAAVVVAAVLVAVLRRRWMLAVQVAVLLVGANLTTELLKHGVFARPTLDGSWGYANTLPSGHTTVAASVSVAALLVVPARARPWTAAVGALYTTATGISTLIGQWHRPSDVVAATLVVLAWTAATCVLVAATPGRPDTRTAALDARAVAQEPGRRSSTRAAHRAVLAALVVVGVAAAFPAVAALRHTWAHVGALGRAGLLVAYGGGAAAAVMASCLTFAAMLALRTAASTGLRRA